MNASQLINQTSGKVEYFTPPEIVDAARKVMGSIDLDPASCEEANAKYVRASRYYTVQENGLERRWFGRVWLNHPFSKENNPKWIGRLVEAWRGREIFEACGICYACTSEKWFQPLFGFPLCFLSPRTNYVLPGGEVTTEVTKGSVVYYLGNNLGGFCDEFGGMGSVMWPQKRIYQVK